MYVFDCRVVCLVPSGASFKAKLKLKGRKMRLVILFMAFVGWVGAVPVGISRVATACDQHVTSATDEEKEVCECGEDEDGECLPCPIDKKPETHPEKQS